VDPPLYTIRKDADGKVVVTTTAQPLPASSVASTDVEAMCGKLAGAAAHVSDPTHHNTIAGICEEAAAMLRQQGESYRMLTAVYNRFVDGRALSVDAIQRHDFTGQDAQRNSQDGNSVVLSADEWDAYRADLNTYSQILALLGMEEEGDPVLAVKLLMQVKHD
jgi:hypothetical protein